MDKFNPVSRVLSAVTASLAVSLLVLIGLNFRQCAAPPSQVVALHADAGVDSGARADAGKKQPHADAAPAPQVRSGGKLSTSEMRAWRSELARQGSAADLLKLKLEQLKVSSASVRAYERVALDQLVQSGANNLRLGTLLRSFAEEHGRDPECFVGVANTDDTRRKCGPELWMFDAKTGEISLAPAGVGK